MSAVLAEYLFDELTSCKSLGEYNAWFYTWLNLMADLAAFLLADDMVKVRSASTNFLKALRFTTKSIMTENAIYYPNVIKVRYLVNII